MDAKSRLLQVAEPGADLQLGRQAVEHPRVSQAQAAGGAEENISIRSNLLKLQVLLSIGNNLGYKKTPTKKTGGGVFFPPPPPPPRTR